MAPPAVTAESFSDLAAQVAMLVNMQQAQAKPSLGYDLVAKVGERSGGDIDGHGSGNQERDKSPSWRLDNGEFTNRPA